MEEEINLYDLWLVIKRNRYLIIGIFFFSVIITMIISLKLPKIYKATARILPLYQSQSSPFSELAERFGIMGGIIGKGSESDLFLAILKSRSMKDAVIDKFNLQQVYKCDTKQGTRSSLAENTKIIKTKENTIEISVLDKNPERSASIANFYVKHLDYLLKNLDITNASYKRKFIEKRMKETEEKLKRIEEQLKNYQEKNKIIIGKESLLGESIGKLQGEYIGLKIKLESLKKFATENNPEIIKIQDQINEMEKQISKLPPLETKIGRIIRDLKIQETLYQLLRSEYERARIEEARDIPRIQVIDYAVVPERKYKPSVKLNMAISGVISLFLGIFLSFLKEFLTLQSAKNNIS